MERVPLGIHITTTLPFAEADAAVREAFKAEGFGVLTEVDVRATLKEKLGVDVEPYVILGICNPRLAHRALEIWKGFGLIAPCHVAIYEGDGRRVVQAIDPMEIDAVTEHPELVEIGREASAAIERVLRAVEARAG